MKSAATKSRPGSEFDKFLFTPLGEDQNGLPLSVVSLLARLNLDPWQEAGTLAALSAEAAAKRLASSLDTLMDPNLRQGNSEATILRLLALLPEHGSNTVNTAASLGAVAATEPGARIGMIVFITSAIFLVGSQIIAAHRESSIPPGAVPDPVAMTVPSHAQPAPPLH